MTAVKVKPDIAEKVKELSLLNKEPEELLKNRLFALEAYSKATLPDRVSHLWKYTDPSLFTVDVNNVEVNNSKIEFNFDAELISKGLIISNLNTAIKNHNELIDKYFSKLLSPNLDKITLLNLVLWSNGYFIYIPKGLKVEKPVIVKSTIEKSCFNAERVLVVLDEDSSINLIHEVMSKEADVISNNNISEIFLSKGAKLNYLSVNLSGKQTTGHYSQKVSFEQNSELSNLIVAFGGKLSKADINLFMNGEKSKASIYGIVMGDSNQKFDHHTTINHNSSYTSSMLDFRVALKDKAQSAYTGNLKIAHEALKCNAVQENRNLLLSEGAKTESIPELEILTNDVEKCSHGVTVGQVDKDQIYYLMSRGLTSNEAEKMIIEGFLEPTISKIPDENLCGEVRAHVQKKLMTL